MSCIFSTIPFSKFCSSSNPLCCRLNIYRVQNEPLRKPNNARGSASNAFKRSVRIHPHSFANQTRTVLDVCAASQQLAVCVELSFGEPRACQKPRRDTFRAFVYVCLCVSVFKLQLFWQFVINGDREVFFFSFSHLELQVGKERGQASINPTITVGRLCERCSLHNPAANSCRWNMQLELQCVQKLCSQLTTGVRASVK